MTEVKLTWVGDAGQVELAGHFTEWQPRPATKQSDREWMLAINLQPGSYQYKWIIDGNWIVDDGKPTAQDESGNKNNIIVVDDSESSGDSDSWERVSVDECVSEQQAASSTYQDGQHSSQDASPQSQDVEEISFVGDISEKSESEASRVTRSSSNDFVDLTQERRSMLVERMFSPGADFEKRISTMAKKVDEQEFEDIYWDTNDYMLLRRGIWLRQRNKEWEIRCLNENSIGSEVDASEIVQRLNQILTTGEQSLEQIVQNKLRENMRFGGRTVNWKLEDPNGINKELELRKEGGIETVRIRCHGDVHAVLPTIYSLAKDLDLNNFRIA